MTLPRDLILIRHGESAGNIAMNAAKNDDLQFYTEEYMNRPGSKWEISETGVKQASATGRWFRVNVHRESDFHFDPHRARYYVSPLTRCRQTAKRLRFSALQPDILEGEDLNPLGFWRKNRAIRERDWGEIELMPRKVYRKVYEVNAKKEHLDPLYWRPPGGESIADVAGNRVSDFFGTLHRECEDLTVFAVTHGEFIRALHLVITRADDEEYEAWEKDSSMSIKNAEAFHYSRYDAKGVLHRKLVRYRRIRPMEVAPGEWESQIIQDWTSLEHALTAEADL